MTFSTDRSAGFAFAGGGLEPEECDPVQAVHYLYDVQLY